VSIIFYSEKSINNPNNASQSNRKTILKYKKNFNTTKIFIRKIKWEKPKLKVLDETSKQNKIQLSQSPMKTPGSALHIFKKIFILFFGWQQIRCFQF